MCSTECSRRLRRFSRLMARYTIRENRWYTRPFRSRRRAVAWPLPRIFWVNAMLLSPLGSREAKVPAGGEIAGMRSYQIQEAGLVLGVAKSAEVLDAGF